MSRRRRPAGEPQRVIGHLQSNNGDFDIVELLGRGTYGAGYRAIWKMAPDGGGPPDGEPIEVVLKRISRDFRNAPAQDPLLRVDVASLSASPASSLRTAASESSDSAFEHAIRLQDEQDMRSASEDGSSSSSGGGSDETWEEFAFRVEREYKISSYLIATRSLDVLRTSSVPQRPVQVCGDTVSCAIMLAQDRNAGEEPDDLYLVFPWMRDSISLDAYVQHAIHDAQPRVSVSRRDWVMVNLFSQILLILQALEQLWIIQNDVKPDNFLVYRHAQTGRMRVMILDFGLGCTTRVFIPPEIDYANSIHERTELLKQLNDVPREERAKLLQRINGERMRNGKPPLTDRRISEEDTERYDDTLDWNPQLECSNYFKCPPAYADSVCERRPNVTNPLDGGFPRRRVKVLTMPIVGSAGSVQYQRLVFPLPEERQLYFPKFEVASAVYMMMLLYDYQQWFTFNGVTHIVLHNTLPFWPNNNIPVTVYRVMLDLTKTDINRRMPLMSAINELLAYQDKVLDGSRGLQDF
jgi:serine/threonine protein kinase